MMNRSQTHLKCRLSGCQKWRGRKFLSLCLVMVAMEAFGGYNRYLIGDKIDRFNRLMPKPGRSVLSNLMQAVSPELWDRLFGLLPKRIEVKNAGDKLHKLASVIPLDNIGIYRQLLSQWPDAYKSVPGAVDPYKTSILNGRGMYSMENFPRWMRWTLLIIF